VTSIELTRHLAVGPERAWSAFADPAEFVAWFWPPRLKAIGDVDARVGGAWRLASEVAGLGVSGVFTAVQRPAHLEFTWRWDGDTAETLVAVSIEPDGDGSVVIVRHDGFVTTEDADSHVEGWSDCLDRLVDYEAH